MGQGAASRLPFANASPTAFRRGRSGAVTGGARTCVLPHAHFAGSYRGTEKVLVLGRSLPHVQPLLCASGRREAIRTDQLWRNTGTFPYFLCLSGVSSVVPCAT